MAFEEATKTFTKAKDIPLGQSLIGYVTGFYNSSRFPDLDNLEMMLEDGKRITLSVTGNLKYFKKNNYPLNVLYKITRLEDVKNKMNTMSAKFKVEYDVSKMTPGLVNMAQAPVATPTDLTSDKIPF